MNLLAAALLAAALQTAEAIVALGRLDDARAAPRLEATLEDRLSRRARFPTRLPPPDLEAEIEAALAALYRLDPEAGVRWARAVLDTGALGSTAWTARRVLAAEGDGAVVRQGLREYFDDPSEWGLVLGAAAHATADRRLQDFAALVAEPAPPSPALLRTRVLRRLDPSAPRALSTLEPPTDRRHEWRSMATRDDIAIVSSGLTPEAVDRLYPYLALSRHRAVRALVRTARGARGPALASLLLATRISGEESREHALAMSDAWMSALVAEPAVFEALASAVGENALDAAVSKSIFLEGIALVPRGSARARLLSLLRGGDTTWLTRESLENLDATGVAHAVRALVGQDPRAATALLFHHERSHAEEFLALLDEPPGALLDRARFAMSLSGRESRLPLLIDLAVRGRVSAPSRAAAFRGLAEQALGRFDKRLHRLAGDPERSVRFQTALALAPTGEAWALRLLFAEVDESSPAERRLAGLALERAPKRERARGIRAMVDDGTATPLAVEQLIADSPAAATGSEELWKVLEPFVATGDLRAAAIALKLRNPGARAAVRALLGRF